MDNYFSTLNQIDCSKHTEKKGQFSYLSWPFAVAQLRLADPTAVWEVGRFDGLPYLKTDAGYFVEIAVTVQGITLSQIHPVLDSRNRSIAEPTAFDINTRIQRCLVKAIALHGLGLYIYAGEDLPTVELESHSKNLRSVRADQPTTISAEQIKHLPQLMTEVNANSQRLLAYFKVEKLADLPAAEYDRVVQSLEKSKRRIA
jgi:hypothetical protein